MTEDDKFRIELHRSDVYYGDPLAADRIEELVKDRDLWKSRYEHHNHERLETLNLNAMQASKIGSLMNTIAKLEKKISKLEKTK